VTGGGGTAAVAGAALPPCGHCLLPIGAEGAVTLDTDAGPLRFCCAGCRSVYRLLREEGLDDFYRRRTGWVPGPPEPGTADPEAFAGSVRETPDGAREAIVAVSGMRCASCVWVIERYLGKKAGVAYVRGNAATSRATVRWDPKAASVADVAGWIRELGYAPHPFEATALEASLEREKRDLLLRFGTAAFLSMQVMMYTAGLYAGYFQGIDPATRTLFNLIALALTTPIVFYAGLPFLRGAWAGLRRRTLGTDALVFLGSFSAYAYSVAAAAADGEIYVDTAAMIVTLVLLGRYLEAVARGRASEALIGLMRLLPARARRVTEEAGPAGPAAMIVDVAALKEKDVVLIIPGDRIPTDGIVASGASDVDESLLTGESRPVPKEAGSAVFAGTHNGSGRLFVEVTEAGGSTVLARIVQAVEEAQARKAPVQRAADRVVAWFVPGILLLSVLTFGYWIRAGHAPVPALLTAVSVLVVACPCALGLATPLAVFIGTTEARAAGILVRGGDVLEAGARVSAVFLDKTGTVTEGRPRLTDVIGRGASPEEVLRIAATLSVPSEHAIGKAILRASRHVDLERAEDWKAVPGMGVEGTIGERRYRLGRPGFAGGPGAEEHGRTAADFHALSSDGKTPVLLAENDGRILGILAVADALRPEAAEAVRMLRDAGYPMTLVTGDGRETAERIAAGAGIGRCLAGVMPLEKADLVREARLRGARVLMAGDGINDAPALTEADVGIAMGRGIDAATSRAGAVLLVEDLRLIPRFLVLSRRTMAVIRGNLAWAFSYNAVAIPAAAAGVLHPILAAGLMAASSLLVMGNSLRLKGAAFR
jgi:P-type Cu2+ transporter